MIMMRDPQSRYFDSVYFILKSELPPGSRECDMVNEAKLIIGANRTCPAPEYEPPKRRRPIDGAVAYFSGAATVGLAAGMIALAAHFIF